MKKTEPEQAVMTDAELDAALAQMAEEAPPMPADFHDRWMNAVRAEAQNAVPAEEPVTDRSAALARWTRILSVAAVFVFLIGGTLLHRNTKKNLSAPYAAEKRDAAGTAVSAAGLAAEEAAPAAVEEAEEARAEESAMTESFLRDEPVQEAVNQTAAENAEKGSGLKAAAKTQNAMLAALPAESADVEAGYDAEAAEYDEAPAFEAEVEAPATAMPTPEPTAAPTMVPAEEPGQAGFLQEARAFFTDMGDFLLAALPYLAVLAVPGVIALAVRRKKNRGR